MKTVKDVRTELPMVPVRFNGARYWGRVSGRLNQFASVYPYELRDNRSKVVKTIMGPIYTFSWEAVTRAVNTGAELNCGEITG